MPEHEITENFLNALHRYFSGEVNARDAAREAKLSGPNKFLAILKEAYTRDYVIIRSPIDQQLCVRFRQWVGLTSKLEPYILKGKPDDRTFSIKAAETFLIYLKRLLLNDEIPELNIGIVSGSSTGSLVEALVTSSLWEEVLAEEEVENVKNKKINIIALNANPVEGWELQGDANISTLHMAMLLKDRLPPEGIDVKPIGISSSVLVIQDSSVDKMEPGPIDRHILEITDPGRLENKGANSNIHIAITGIGSPEDSIFTQIMDSEGIEVPEGTVGDVAYSAVDEDGNELSLTKKDGVNYSVYSAIRLETMKQLVDSGSVVMLVARNCRRGKQVNKTPAIRAAIRGRYINVICTDEQTALEIMKEPA